MFVTKKVKLPWFIGLRTQGWNYLFINIIMCGFFIIQKKE